VFRLSRGGEDVIDVDMAFASVVIGAAGNSAVHQGTGARGNTAGNETGPGTVSP
jgi:hypothetical protein